MIRDRINALRNLMQKNKIQAYLVPSTDPHQNEYLPARWERRKWISGFTGSAGELAVTRYKAGLWTDSRYFLQAEQQLKGTSIRLFKIGVPEIPSLMEWLKTELKAGERVGIDPQLISYQEYQKLDSYLRSWKINLTAVSPNLVDKIWPDQPAFPESAVQPHALKYAGQSTAKKLHQLREKMKQAGAAAHVITTLDANAWLFNIRGRDIEYNPLVICYSIITPRQAMLFIPLNKVSLRVKKQLGSQVKIYPYQQFAFWLKKLSSQKIKIWIDPATVSWWVVDSLKKKVELFFKESPITHLKAVRNKIQIAGLKAAQLRDGVAMVKFLCWLQQEISRKPITELSAAEKLYQFRSEQDLFQGLSFQTISAYREHGAIVHYSATAETDIPLKRTGIYLIDSGAHYQDGTTDITRTIALGKPTRRQRELFTRVLQGHIQLATACFPSGTAGNQLDTLARKPLWDAGLNYGHGTGHGIGSYLNVHEGPQAISYYRGIGVALEPGMVISNEPGYYQTGEYGIRIENLILTVVYEKSSSPGSEFLTFETVTWCPIDLTLVDPSRLNASEISWLNHYHRQVRIKLTPFLNRKEAQWLERATRAI
jgi:Xaa-Pro aminopeptidase